MNYLFSTKLGCLAALSLSLGSALLKAQPLPEKAPRTWILPEQDAIFQESCTTGAGADNYAIIKADFDDPWLNSAFPKEPQKYGDHDH